MCMKLHGSNLRKRLKWKCPSGPSFRDLFYLTVNELFFSLSLSLSLWGITARSLAVSVCVLELKAVRVKDLTSDTARVRGVISEKELGVAKKKGWVPFNFESIRYDTRYLGIDTIPVLVPFSILFIYHCYYYLPFSVGYFTHHNSLLTTIWLRGVPQGSKLVSFMFYVIVGKAFAENSRSTRLQQIAACWAHPKWRPWHRWTPTAWQRWYALLWPLPLNTDYTDWCSSALLCAYGCLLRQHRNNSQKNPTLKYDPVEGLFIINSFDRENKNNWNVDKRADV